VPVPTGADTSAHLHHAQDVVHAYLICTAALKLFETWRVHVLCSSGLQVMMLKPIHHALARLHCYPLLSFTCHWCCVYLSLQIMTLERISIMQKVLAQLSPRLHFCFLCFS
jgi:hypothetical protein